MALPVRVGEEKKETRESRDNERDMQRGTEIYKQSLIKQKQANGAEGEWQTEGHGSMKTLYRSTSTTLSNFHS